MSQGRLGAIWGGFFAAVKRSETGETTHKRQSRPVAEQERIGRSKGRQEREERVRSRAERARLDRQGLDAFPPETHKSNARARLQAGAFGAPGHTQKTVKLGKACHFGGLITQYNCGHMESACTFCRKTDWGAGIRLDLAVTL